MVYYLLMPLVSILLIVLQITIADVIFSGRLVMEISLIVVICVAFRLDLVKGVISCFVLGFVYDCIAGSVLGLFALIYTVVFLVSFFISLHLIAEEMHLVALLTLLCALLEELIIFIFYNLAYGYNAGQNNPLTFLSRVLIVSALAPLLFSVLHKFEVFFYGKTAQSAERSGSGRASAEI